MIIEKVFLGKIENNSYGYNVFYLSLKGFECEHYFGGLHLVGARFSGFEDEFLEQVKTNFDNVKTIMTKEELLELFSLNNELKKLGYGIEKYDERYTKGMEIYKQMYSIIENKLLTNENDDLFLEVQKEEKECLKNEYNLSDDEVNEIFKNYTQDYKDSGIINAIFKDFDDMIYEEKFSFGYENTPYFNDKEFGEDLLNSGMYYELESGKIAYYCY